MRSRQLGLLPPPTTKRCGGPCRQERPVEAFGRSVTARDGLQAWCKDCFAENMRLHHNTRPAAPEPRRSAYENVKDLLYDIESALLADNPQLALLHIGDAREDWRL